MKKIEDSTNKEIEIDTMAKYLRRGVWQDFQKFHFLRVIFYFCLFDIFISQIISIIFATERIHFTKEIARWSMNVIYSIISYLIGRKHERVEIQEQITKENNNTKETD